MIPRSAVFEIGGSDVESQAILIGYGASLWVEGGQSNTYS
jgi:hypothetical protein